MSTKSAILLCIFTTMLTMSALSQNKVVGYYPDWQKTALPTADLQFENLTHIIHAFAWPEADGSITHYVGMLDPNLNDAVHQADRKILISMGGWGQSNGFSPMAADSATRATFVANVVDFCLDNDYDGVDLDWEHPSNAADKNNLTKLVRELRQAFDDAAPEMLITMAVTAGNWNGQWIDYPAIKADMSWFNLMAYDFHGTWTPHAGHNAPLYQASNDFDGAGHLGVQYLNITRGVDKSQIVLGMPFYGKEFAASALYASSTGGDISYGYRDLLGFLDPASGWTRHWDAVSQVPYLTDAGNSRLITYDDTTSVRIKAEYALNNGLAGVMIWSLGQDVTTNGQPLLETLGRVVLTPSSISDTPQTLSQSFELYENYPNPFNSTTIIRYALSTASEVRLTIYNLLGQELQVVVNERQAIGEYQLQFDAGNLPTGIYYYVMDANQHREVRKMVLSR